MNSPLKFRSSVLRCARMMSDEINTLLLPYRLNYSLWQVLFVIQQRNGCTSIEIADYLNVSKPSIAKRIHSLMQLNVLQHIETDDKRKKMLVLSPCGEQLFCKCAETIDQFEQNLIQHFDAELLQTSSNLLQQIIQHLEYSKSGDIHD
jgi:DNA-binding MarR family transcriptional regulator